MSLNRVPTRFALATARDITRRAAPVYLLASRLPSTSPTSTRAKAPRPDNRVLLMLHAGAASVWRADEEANHENCCQLSCQMRTEGEAALCAIHTKPLEFRVSTGRWDGARTCNLRFWSTIPCVRRRSPRLAATLGSGDVLFSETALVIIQAASASSERSACGRDRYRPDWTVAPSSNTERTRHDESGAISDMRDSQPARRQHVHGAHIPVAIPQRDIGSLRPSMHT
jgi:hypothetical protein